MKKNLFLFPLLVLAGCALFGNNPSQPNGVEKVFFNQVTNTVLRIVEVTNVVPIYQTNFQILAVNVTNSQNQIVPVLVTNSILNVVWQTNLATVTNTVQVTQLVPGTGEGVATTGAGIIGSLWGVGGIASTLLAGLFAGYLKVRNNALAGNATVAGQTVDALTQEIETLLNVVQTTPQGAAMAVAVKGWLVNHQATAGVIQQVAESVQQIDQPQAQQAAAEILKVLQTFQNPAPKPPS